MKFPYDPISTHCQKVLVATYDVELEPIIVSLMALEKRAQQVLL